jgi:hypothetical protein
MGKPQEKTPLAAPIGVLMILALVGIVTGPVTTVAVVVGFVAFMELIGNRSVVHRLLLLRRAVNQVRLDDQDGSGREI